MSHTAFIAISYGFAAFATLALGLWILRDHRAQQRRLAEMDAARLPEGH